MMTKQQNARFHQLLGELGLKDEKAALVRRYTNGRASSSKELSFAEARALIEDLEKLLGKRQVQQGLAIMRDVAAGLAASGYPAPDVPTELTPATRAQRMSAAERKAWREHLATVPQIINQRKKVYAILYDLRWTQPDGRLDFDLFNAWIAKKGVVKGDLRDMNTDDLMDLIRQMEGVRVNNRNADAGRAVAKLKEELGLC